jgi:MFS family permease
MFPDVLLLFLCQAMLMTGVSLVLTSSALVGAQLAPDPIFATAPLSVQYLATMVALLPVSHAMHRYGRRAVFVVGALIGTVGVALATIGIYGSSFLVFTLAGALIGINNAVGQFYRFAAAEAVDAGLRSRAISLTLAGGVIAAVLGPNLARLTHDALQPPFTASFLTLTVTTLLASLFASRLRLPPVPGETATGERRPMAEIARQPVFIVAVVVGMLGYGEMNLLMTAAPLAMHSQHHNFAATAEVIQWHVVAMFAPSFFTGDLIRRFGVLRVMLVGAGLVLVCIFTNLSGMSVTHFELALIFVGVGWNFLYIGATTLLTEAYRPSERAHVQGLNDTMVFTTVALSSLASGGLVAHFGWKAINIVALPALLIIVTGIWWLGWHRARVVARPTTL